MQARDERRDSPRVLTRLYVRGLGADREWTDQLGDLGLGGVGFELPHAPAAHRYQVRFVVPGETKLRTATAEVRHAVPMPGASELDGPFFVHLAFVNLSFEDELAIARALDRLEASVERALEVSLGGINQGSFALDFDIDEAAHSMLPHISSLPERLARGEGGMGQYVFGAISRDVRALSSRTSA